MEDLARLVDDLDLLLVVAVRLQPPTTGHDVVGELVRIRGDRRLRAVGDGPGLLLELVDKRPAGAGGRLIGRHQHPLETDGLLERIESDRQRDRAAVGVGDDALVLTDVLGVDLGHHERDVLLHAPGGAVVDHERARLGGGRAIHQRDVTACGEERHVDAFECRLVDLLDVEGRAVVGNGQALGALRSQGDDALAWKVALREHAKHLGADHSGRADDSNV